MKKSFKSQASAANARAASAALGASSSPFGFASSSSNGFQAAPSSLSYISEQPDLSIISDANLVVTLRNLGKKDSTTKAKALEELQEYVSSTASAEVLDAGLLEAWISLYPRTSIDNARRVRQLAHTLQGVFTVLAGKRIAAHLPKVIGAWLAGAYDSDRSVARTAQDSIVAAFTSDEKRRALWRIYKNALVEYAKDAILVQTTKTLSDERSTTPDDAEAKYVRVVGTAMQMLSQVIKINFHASQNLDQTEIDQSLKNIVGDKKLWEYSSHQDPTLRRAACNLVRICADVLGPELDWTTLSACFVGKGLHSSQLGSSRQFSEALHTLTAAHPSIWTTDYTSKTPASKRLTQYLRKGSQRGPIEYWSDIKALIEKIPVATWVTFSDDEKIALDSSITLLESLQMGINSNEEPRQNLEAAWSTYVDISFWALRFLGDTQSRSALLETGVVPLLAQFVTSDPRKNAWNMPSFCNAKISASILTQIVRQELLALFENTWASLCQSLSDNMKLSLPESSKEFSSSQESVIAQARRLCQLRSLMLEGQSTDSRRSLVADVVRTSDERLTETAIEILKGRNGKPYGAAYVLEVITRDSPSPSLDLFLESDAVDLLTSPSAEYLVSLLQRDNRDLAQVLTTLIAKPDNPNATKALKTLLGSMPESPALQNPRIESFLVDQVRSHLESDSAHQIIGALLRNSKLALSALHEKCCQQLLTQLSPDTEVRSQHSALRFLRALLSDRTQNISLFNGDIGSLLLTKLLLLSDSNDAETVELATSLLAKIKIASVGKSSPSASSSAIIADQLSGKGEPLSVFVLVDLAKDVISRSGLQQGSTDGTLLPSAEDWRAALEDHLTGRPPLSLSITSPLRGLVFALKPEHTIIETQSADLDGFSSLFRLTLFTTRMLLDTEAIAAHTDEQLNVLYLHYPLALQLVNEKLTMDGASDVWQTTNDEVTEEAADVLSQGNTLVQEWVEDGRILDLWMEEIKQTDTLEPRTYYSGLAFTDVASHFVDKHGPMAITIAFESEIAELHRSKELLRSASLIAVCRDHFISSQQGRKLVNEFVATVTGLKSPWPSNLELRPLILLDILLSESPEALETIPSQRQNFLMQSLVRMQTDATATLAVRTLATRLLEPVVIAIKDLYGGHWEQMLQALATVLQSESTLSEDLSLLHASLRLYSRLRSVANSEEANEDLLEAWKLAQPSLEDGLLICLDVFEHTTDLLNEPRRITAELLRRQLSKITARHDPNLYTYLSSREDAIRGAAYDLLHRSIPAEQEQLSLDVALEKRVVHLPPELLAMMSGVTPPAVDVDPPLQRSFLLSWILMFDHFPNASYKLQAFYIADVKQGGVLGRLLDLICEVCRIISSRPIDASKSDVRVFELGTSETDEQEDQRLAIHLYYCCLLYLPGLTRSWFIEQKNRVKSPLESWTQKYFAPALVSAAATTVTEWVKGQPQEDSETPLTVKPSIGGFEMVASVIVDPESPPVSLVISLPKSYPLESPTVSSRTRVGVSEKNWQSWLRTIQIIIFSTGSVIEGLIAFRRNVQGVMKGQSECAICYSIIGTDMQTANKRCGTCRNTFHGSCLFRWFSSSNSSSCPLCRNNFNYA